MAKIRYLLERDGSFYARLVVPRELRPLVGKTELSSPLNAAGRAEAIRKLASAVAPLQAQIEAARQRTVADDQRLNPRKHHALNLHELAQSHYEWSLRMDTGLRVSNPAYALIGFDDVRRDRLRSAIAGAMSDDELESLIGSDLVRFESNGNIRAARGTAEWRQAAIAVCVGELEGMRRMAERDEGDFSGKPNHPLLTETPVVAVPKDDLSARAISADSSKPLSELLATYTKERGATGRSDYDSEITVRMLEEHLGEARPVYRITRADVNSFKRALAETPANYTKRFPGKTLPDAIKANAVLKQPFPRLSAKTINDKYLSKLHAHFNWCRNNDIIPDNPAAGVKLESVGGSKKPPRVPFDPGDLTAIFDPQRFDTARPFSEAQWAMLISLFSGHRPSELAQTKLNSIRHERGVLVFVVEEETKTESSQRIVPVHSTLVSLGLEKHIISLRAKHEAHLFPEWYRKGMEAKAKAEKRGKRMLNHYFPRFIPKLFNNSYRKEVGITDSRKVFYSFRHTFKTGLAMAGVDRATRDDLAGHQDYSAGAGYVHGKSVEVLRDAVEKLRFDGFALTMPVG